MFTILFYIVDFKLLSGKSLYSLWETSLLLFILVNYLELYLALCMFNPRRELVCFAICLGASTLHPSDCLTKVKVSDYNVLGFKCD